MNTKNEFFSRIKTKVKGIKKTTLKFTDKAVQKIIEENREKEGIR